MISFPATTWQRALLPKTTKRRPRNSTDNGHGRAASVITPRLYLSDLHSALAPGNLARLGITHVVSAIEVDVRREFGDNVMVMHVPIRDDINTDIGQWFERVVRFIQGALDADQQNKVLVHCLQGISRSATLVCAYLVATTPMGAREAIAYVKARRGIISPNFGFRRQLMAWERQFEVAKAEERRRRPGMLSKWLWLGRRT